MQRGCLKKNDAAVKLRTPTEKVLVTAAGTAIDAEGAWEMATGGKKAGADEEGYSWWGGSFQLPAAAEHAVGAAPVAFKEMNGIVGVLVVGVLASI